MNRRRNLTGRLAISLGSVLLLAACGQSTQTATPETPPSPIVTASPTEASPSPSPSPTEEPVVWEDNSMVSHIFFHSLVVDPHRAFDGGESSAGYLNYMVTVDEFTDILQQVYERDYVLVSPHDLYTVTPSGSIEDQPLELPEGKTPLVMSFDDLSYYEYMDNDGFADRLVLSQDSVLTEYTDAEGTTHIGHYDYVPILDAFIAEHPDFSHDGAKGVIALTGYNGIFGYRTSDISYGDTNNTIHADKRTAAALAEALKDTGWEFASHSWGHINFTNSSVSYIAEDHEKWRTEVEPLIGETDLLIYPFGADIAGVAEYSGPKFEYLKGQGFNAFFHVDGSVPAWGQFRDDYIRQARINIDGISLKNAVDGRWEAVREFFVPEEIIDPLRPSSISGG